MSDLIYVNVKHFCAGLIINEKGIVIRSAPILKGWIGKHYSECEKYYKRKGALKEFIIC